MSAANQVRLLSLNTQQLSATLGQGLVSAIAPVIAWLNALIKRLIQAAVAFRTFMWTLFGKPLAAVRGLVNDTAGYLDDAAGAAGDLGSAGGGAADGLGSAGKAAKDLKKQLTLLPFDQLNQLSKDTDSAGSGGSGGGGGGGVGGLGDLGDLGIMPDLGDAITDSPVINAINEWAARIREAFQKHQWANLGRIVAEGINAGFAFIYDVLDWNKLKPIIVDGFITPFQTAFNTMMDYINWDLIGKTLGRGLMDIVYTLRAWITGFHWRDFGTDLAEAMNGFINEIHPDQIGRLIADKFKAAWNFFGGWVSTFDFSVFGYSLRDGLVAFIDELDPKDMGESLGKFLNGIADAILAFLGDGSVRENLASAFAEFVNGFVEELDAEKVRQALKSVTETIFGVIKDAFKEIDVMPLVGDFITVLSGLPWGFIWKCIFAHATLALGKVLSGGILSKVLADALVSTLTGGGGAGIASGIAAKLGGGGAASGGAAATGSAAATAAGAVGSLKYLMAGGAGIIGATLMGGMKLNDYVQKHGGVGQFQGQNFAPQYQQQKQQSSTGKQNAAGYNTKIQTVQPNVPKPQNTTSTMTLTAKLGSSFVTASKSWFSIYDTSNLKTLLGKQSSSFNSSKSIWDGWKSGSITKTTNAVRTAVFNTSKSVWDKWISQTITKKADSSVTGAYTDVKSRWAKWVSETILKTANGKGTSAYWDVSDNYYGLKDKWITAHFDVESSVRSITADLANGASEVVARFITNYNAAGGLFTGATGFQVFGEAGAEAAIPLERKSTMKRIGNAIVNAGGMGTSNSDDIADAVAERLAPIIMSAISGQGERPVNVNAVLYTENNEVLARAVNQGNRQLDKRYRPVSQYSY